MKAVSQPPSRIAFDRQTFERLIEAAYVLQEHNRQMNQLEKNLESQSEQLREQERAQQSSLEKDRSPKRKPRNTDYMVTLAEIVEAQHQIQMRQLELEKTLGLIAESVARITRASGAAIAILNSENLCYRAGSGSTALPVGTEVALKGAICQASIRTGQVIQTKDVNTEFLFDPEPIRKRGIRSLLAVPIHHDGEIVGGLELYFEEVEGYAEQDIHTCQLMAGLVTEALGREAGVTLKKSMAEERSTMLAAIEKLQPNLTALAAGPSPQPDRSADLRSQASREVVCWKCGNSLGIEEQFCGNCGAHRTRNIDENSMQSNLAPARNVQQRHLSEEIGAAGNLSDANRLAEENESAATRKSSSEAAVETAISSAPPFTASEAEELVNSLASISETEVALPAEIEPASEDPVIPTQPSDVPGDELVWSSASRAQDFLESLPTYRVPGPLVRFWRSRRGDFYLAIAIALVVLVIGWGIWSNHVGGAGANTAVHNANRVRHVNPDANLTLLDRLLINVGLAERPEPPAYKGNPDVQVWVDLNTAQYYCPGSDLYGKTARGKLSTQREAQMDQFEPAYRKACE